MDDGLDQNEAEEVWGTEASSVVKEVKPIWTAGSCGNERKSNMSSYISNLVKTDLNGRLLGYTLLSSLLMSEYVQLRKRGIDYTCEYLRNSENGYKVRKAMNISEISS